MARRPIRNPARGRDAGNARPPGRGELGGFISPDASAGRRRPLPAWLPEAPDPPPRGEDSAVRLIPFDEAATTPPATHVHPVDEHGTRLDAPPGPRHEEHHVDETDPTGLTTEAIAASAATAPVTPGVTSRPVEAAPPVPSRPAHPARPPAQVRRSRAEGAAAPPAAPGPRRLGRVLGVNIDGGVAYLAVVDAPDRVRLDVLDRLAPRGDRDPHVALADFAARVARVLRELQVDAVGVVRPLRYANWRYADAFARVSLETCFMVEASRQSLRFEWVGQQHASNVLGVPVDRLTESLAGRLGVERGPGWIKRSPALVVALAIASEAGH
jgi:pyruvate/2-oxoglutarate dehydrogenase complex dihydrolipoamide acyltransferase (E2) component